MPEEPSASATMERQPTSERQSSRHLVTGFSLVAVAAALWGTDALFRTPLAGDIPAGAVVFAEHLILVPLTVPRLRGCAAHLKTLSLTEWMALVFIGVGASALATVLFTEAFTYGDVTTPLLLQKLQPLVALVGAHLLLPERMTVRFAPYVIVGLAGGYLISFPNPGVVSVQQVTVDHIPPRRSKLRRSLDVPPLCIASWLSRARVPPVAFGSSRRAP